VSVFDLVGATFGPKQRLVAESMRTALARMPGGQASSGAPVSAAAACAQATTGAEAQKSAAAAAQATTGAQAQKSAESIQTAFARMPGGQASSGAPVSAAAACAQATTGAEAQKSAAAAAQATTGAQAQKSAETCRQHLHACQAGRPRPARPSLQQQHLRKPRVAYSA